jgi:RNA polymerase-interacting CarD/CdnL/TRCF family regulator
MSQKFEVGDTVVIQGQGPGTIDDRVHRQGSEMYAITLFSHRGYLVPVDEIDDVVREPVSEQCARELIDELRGAHPDDRSTRERAEDVEYARLEGTLEDQIAVLGSLYASNTVNFGLNKMASELERIALAELALVLDLETDDLADQLREELEQIDRPPKPPDLTSGPSGNLDHDGTTDDGPELEGYEYVGTFRVDDGLVIGDPGHVIRDTVELPISAALDARSGAWDAFADTRTIPSSNLSSPTAPTPTPSPRRPSRPVADSASTTVASAPSMPRCVRTTASNPNSGTRR